MTAAPAAVAEASSRTAAVVVDSKTVDIRRRRRRRMTEMNSCPVSAAAAAGPAGPDRDRACSSWPLALRDAELSSSLSIRYMSRRRGAQAGAILLHDMALSRSYLVPLCSFELPLPVSRACVRRLDSSDRVGLRFATRFRSISWPRVSSTLNVVGFRA